MVQTVVGQTAALRMEIIMPPLQRADEGAETIDVHIRGGGKPLHPGVETGGSIHRQRLVRPKCRQHPGRMPLPGKRAMMFQRVYRIVRRAHDLDLELFEDALCRQRRRGQLVIGLFPDLGGGLFAQQVRDAEITPQLKVRPMIQRVAQRVRHRPRPRLELLLRRSVAGDEFLRHTVAAHRPPLVMIPLQPDLKQVPEPPVLRNVPWRYMTVIIENRLPLGKLPVQSPRRHAPQQKFFVDEWHMRSPPTAFKPERLRGAENF